MDKKKFISWRRVSTWKQGDSKLGLNAQMAMINDHVGDNELIADYSEVYTGKDLSGCMELRKAINHCKETGATLIIAKTDRFRNVHEALGICKELENQIYFCNVPTMDNMSIILLLPLMFAIAELEAKNISTRIKAALAEKEKRDGNWNKEYGKHTGSTRSETISIAQKVSACNRSSKAASNENNKRFWAFVMQFKQSNNLASTDDFKKFTEFLNEIGLKTATGKEFNTVRARAMYSKCKKFYLYNK